MSDQTDSLRLQIEAQITGIRNHLRYITELQHREDTNEARALGHLKRALHLAKKLRRLNTFHLRYRQAAAGVITSDGPLMAAALQGIMTDYDAPENET